MSATRLATESLVAFVATQNPTQAKDFYQKTLGLRLVSEDQFALVFDANGTALRVAIVGETVIAPYTVLGWKVKRIGDTVKALGSAGVKFERFEGLDQDDSGIWTAPGGAKVAWFKDPDGNLLSVAEY